MKQVKNINSYKYYKYTNAQNFKTSKFKDNFRSPKIEDIQKGTE